jgi:hypothetical protein
MGCVYGDSTPFPFGADFIETVRHAVEQGVQLLAAQEAITTARARGGSVESIRQGELARLAALGDAVAVMVNGFASSRSERVVRVGARILDSAHALIDQEVAALDGHTTGEISSSRATVESARQRAFRAVESFVLRHDLPGTEVGLRLVAGEQSYSGQALVTTPFGVEAVFDLAIPAAHEWGRPRRVVEISAGTEVHVPKESGFFSKRIEPVLVKLDKLFVSEVAISDAMTTITVRKGPRSGAGYQIEVSSEGAPKAMLHLITEEGGPAPDAPLELDGDDSVHVMRLWNRVVESTRDLVSRRQSMTEATFDGEGLRESDEPRALCERMVQVLSPIVQEISRRSGAPGELVLRRDLGEGRREEVYITKAELQEKIEALPPGMQGAFIPFELGKGPRSPRAPAHSEPIDLRDDDTDKGFIPGTG